MGQLDSTAAYQRTETLKNIGVNTGSFLLNGLGGALATPFAFICLGQSTLLTTLSIYGLEEACRYPSSLFKDTVRLINPKVNFHTGDDAMRGHTLSLAKCADTYFCAKQENAVKKGAFLKARFIALISIPPLIVLRITDLALAVLFVPFALLTCGKFSRVNTLAIQQLQGALVISDLVKKLLFALNPKIVLS